MTAYTPIYNLPYVEASDLVANYPTISEELAENVEAAIESSGKVLQVVRATDSTLRSTTSTSFVDANISVTITPQKSDSSLILLWASYVAPSGAPGFNRHQITDSSNVAISGAEAVAFGTPASGPAASHILIGYATPATTSAVTYKGRFHADSGGTARILNGNTTGQLFAIEVSA